MNNKSDFGNSIIHSNSSGTLYIKSQGFFQAAKSEGNGCVFDEIKYLQKYRVGKEKELILLIPIPIVSVLIFPENPDNPIS
jgi:hypothetical protein